jgi:hypothetical protein
MWEMAGKCGIKNGCDINHECDRCDRLRPFLDCFSIRVLERLENRGQPVTPVTPPDGMLKNAQ